MCFGVVESIEIFGSGLNMFAEIIYKDDIDAFNALMKFKVIFNHFIKNARLADMDRQPESQFFFIKTPILKINNDCLMKIIKYLSFVDQMILARACKRINNIIHTIWRNEKKIEFLMNYNKVNAIISSPDIKDYYLQIEPCEEENKCFINLDFTMDTEGIYFDIKLWPDIIKNNTFETIEILILGCDTCESKTSCKHFVIENGEEFPFVETIKLYCPSTNEKFRTPDLSALMAWRNLKLIMFEDYKFFNKFNNCLHEHHLRDKDFTFELCWFSIDSLFSFLNQIMIESSKKITIQFDETSVDGYKDNMRDTIEKWNAISEV